MSHGFASANGNQNGASSPATRAGAVVFASGQSAIGHDGATVGAGDPETQARQCYANLRVALESAGATLGDVVLWREYAVHPGQRWVLSKVRTEVFSPPYPAGTSVVVRGLARPEFLFEVEAIAVVDAGEGHPDRRQYLDPPGLYRSPSFTQVVKAGNLVYVSGQCANVPDPDVSDPYRQPRLVGLGDPEVQARQCFENLRIALEAAGARPRDVLKLNTFCVKFDYQTILQQARDALFEPPFPAATGVMVASLYHPGALFEVEAIAAVSPP